MSKSIVLLIVCLAALAVGTSAQSAAQKSWPAFWKAFSTAVEKRNKPAIKRLMATEREFFSGGGSENRDEWLQLIDEQRWWSGLQRSVRGGSKADTGNSSSWPARVTQDGTLCFGFIRGRWRFTGPMGD